MEPYLALKDIAVRYQEKEIVNVDQFSVYKGEILGLMGENGAGKSTLLRVFALLEKPVCGQVLIQDRFVSNVHELRRNIALVFQDPLLFKGTVAENISYPLKIRKLAKSEIEKHCKRVADAFEIGHLLSRHVDTLSGGEAKRICLARALVYEPAVLLLDEPFSDLDINIRKIIENKLFDYLKLKNITAIFVSHDFEDIARFCDRLAVMERGRIAQIGTVSEITRAPSSRSVANILGDTTFIEARIKNIDEDLAVIEASEHEFAIAGQEVFKEGQKVLLNLRPEDIFVSNNGAFKNSSVRNSFKAKIVGIDKRQSYCRLKLESGFSSNAIITKQSLEELNLYKGKIIVAGFKATAAKLLPKTSG